MKKRKRARARRRRRAQRTTTRTVSTRTVIRNPLQAGAHRFAILAIKRPMARLVHRRGRSSTRRHVEQLHYDGAKFTKRGRPLTFAYENQAKYIRVELLRRFRHALAGYDLLVK